MSRESLVRPRSVVHRVFASATSVSVVMLASCALRIGGRPTQTGAPAGIQPADSPAADPPRADRGASFCPSMNTDEDVTTLPALVVSTVCRAFTAGKPGVAFAVRSIYRGDQSPIPPAAYLATCRDLDRDVNSYFAWRECKELEGAVDEHALGVALAEVTSPAGASRFIEEVHNARAKIAALASSMATQEAQFPGDKLLYDDTAKVVSTLYAPAFARWQPQLTEVERFEDAVRDDPNRSASPDCRDTSSGGEYTGHRSRHRNLESARRLKSVHDCAIRPSSLVARAICHDRWASPARHRRSQRRSG